MEFFYAKAHMRKPMLIDDRVWNPYWMTSFYFYIGIQKDCPELLEKILRITPTTEGQRWTRLANLPSYLLAGFASPYEIAEKGVAQAMQEAAELYTDVSDNVIESPFGVFPKLHFLWLVQMLIRRNYGYEFFKKAIALATVQISEECKDRKRCALAIFFLSVISRDLDEKACFDFLIQNYHQDLPLEVELGIRHETNDDRQRSHLVKKLDQRMVRSLKASPSLQKLVSSLYERPLRSNKLVKPI